MIPSFLKISKESSFFFPAFFLSFFSNQFVVQWASGLWHHSLACSGHLLEIYEKSDIMMFIFYTADRPK